MHRVQLIQILHCERVQSLVSFLFNKLLEVLLRILPLFDFSLQKFLERLYFLKGASIFLLMSLALLLCFLNYLQFNGLVVILHVF